MRHLDVGRSRWKWWRSRLGRCASVGPLREVVGHYSSALLRPSPTIYEDVHLCVNEVDAMFPV